MERPPALSVAEPPIHIEVEGGILIFGPGLTVTLILAVAEQPLEYVNETEYIPDINGFTFIIEGFCEFERKPLGPLQV